eukprot:Plantae.Rhodophyta-Purpureofilum_apyrenoidigerum.ctg1705.p1 GENE.Plantae.Rhodophyta-Purpureofilum_apyrenoidigerum.ctg1705~~Plantae.Rhodophyta-Purpureofilum_apyrenoidigerum.ctg1705.p1  ORF type:complete len:268 (-),score=30.54 Plantae.Rhodophyta-Purpureofilum_apyrenoidigerum.ctg1705:224-958(-)
MKAACVCVVVLAVASLHGASAAPSVNVNGDVTSIRQATATPTPTPTPTSTSTPTPAPTETDSASNSTTCFPATSTVRLENGERKAMKDVSLGDKVQCGSDVYCEVYMFGHRDADVQATYLSIATTGGKVLQASASHYILANDKLVSAGALKVGDEVISEDGVKQTIASITSSIQEGAYNLHTTNGYVVVDGILASSYTTACHPVIARLLLLPIRALYNMGVTTNILEKSTPMLQFMAPSGPSVL